MVILVSLMVSDSSLVSFCLRSIVSGHIADVIRYPPPALFPFVSLRLSPVHLRSYHWWCPPLALFPVVSCLVSGHFSDGVRL